MTTDKVTRNGGKKGLETSGTIAYLVQLCKCPLKFDRSLKYVVSLFFIVYCKLQSTQLDRIISKIEGR